MTIFVLTAIAGAAYFLFVVDIAYTFHLTFNN